MFSGINTDGDVLTHLATTASQNDCCTSLSLLCVVQYFLGVLEYKHMSLQCYSSFQVCLCQYVALVGEEGRLVGCCPRLRGYDLGKDSSPVPSLPFTMERMEKGGRQKKGEITNPFFISTTPSSLIDSLCFSGHLFSPLYYRTRHSGSVSSSRQTMYQLLINAVVHPHVALGLTDR